MPETVDTTLLLQARARLTVALNAANLEATSRSRADAFDAGIYQARKVENARAALRLIGEYIEKVGGAGEVAAFVGLCLWAGDFLFWWGATP